MRRIGVPHDHGGEAVVLHFAEQVQTVEPLQIVEAVAALQVLHLRLEHELEGRAEHAAERHRLFGKAADPQIDAVEAAKPVGRAIGAGAIQEVEPVGRSASAQSPRRSARDQRQGRVALAFERRLRR